MESSASVALAGFLEMLQNVQERTWMSARYIVGAQVALMEGYSMYFLIHISLSSLFNHCRYTKEQK